MSNRQKDVPCPNCGYEFNPLFHAQETDPVGIVYCPKCKTRLQLIVTIGGYTGAAAAKIRHKGDK